ncbi:MAG: putative acyl-CoA transferase/carnitine dehydratase [Acidimicrobiales bacterium]|nr:putative acyl-CoA transferase/carnitine dehydratase [Acidimicrobiales bacterium]
MKLGDIGNEGAVGFGKPLDGIRVLAAEQMQALPYATQLLARLGADVVKVEHPTLGDSGRGSSPFLRDPDGRAVGATFLRNNFNKRSVGIDLKAEEGKALFLDLVPHFDVVAENFKAGTLERLGLGYEVIAERHPTVVHVSLSGFGNDSPYRDWAAYAAVVEAMSGIYHYKTPDGPPKTIPVGALGDISSALFATIGVLAALRHRDRTGEGQHVDVAMLDAMVAMTDLLMNLWSLGARQEPDQPLGVICEGFRCSDGYVVAQVVREHQFAKLADLVGKPEWHDDPRFADRYGWEPNLDDVIRPAVEAWSSTRTRAEAAAELAAAGIAAGPSQTAPEVIADPHLALHDMVVEMPRPDGVHEPVLVPGNPVKLSKVAEGPETRVPWLGEHTDEVLGAELGLGPERLAALREAGVIG